MLILPAWSKRWTPLVCRASIYVSVCEGKEADQDALGLLDLISVQTHGPITQRQFLLSMGIEVRTTRLNQSSSSSLTEESSQRLISPFGMGEQYKFLGFENPPSHLSGTQAPKEIYPFPPWSSRCVWCLFSLWVNHRMSRLPSRTQHLCCLIASHWMGLHIGSHPHEWWRLKSEKAWVIIWQHIDRFTQPRKMKCP